MATIVTRSGKGYPLTWDEMDTNLTNLNHGSFVSVTDSAYGAVGDGIVDDGPAFNLALASGQSVAVPPGDYLIKTQIVINSATSLYGIGGPTPFTATGPGPRLIYHTDLGSNPMILCKESSVISNLGFLGPAKGGSTIAIRNQKDTSVGVSYEDMDVTLTGNYFALWGTAVEHYNRGLNLSNNNIALVAYGVNLFWDNANYVDDPANVFDALPEGFRAIRIENNRFHANNIAINNTGTDALYLRGLKVLGNHIDIGDELFYGGLYSGIFSSNTVDQTGAALGLIGFSSTAQEVTITGNTLKNASSYGINFGGAVNGAVITGNSISEVGTAGDGTTACIRFINSATNVAIAGNYFNPKTDGYCVRGTTPNAWTGVAIQGNAWNRSRTLSGIYVDGGNNSIQV